MSDCMENCPFCRVAAGVGLARVVKRWNGATAFFPLSPATLGHTLLIPNMHIPDIWSLDVETARQLSVYSLELANVVNATLSPDGMNIINSNGGAASQTVGHLHIHFVPRWQDDRMGEIWPKDRDWPENELDGLAAKLSRELRL
ncbi:HIT family protein [Amycolatopsis sp. WQ 127309]|uniref:HIT family protein n=1 Tax=Amycolatopsis sp. WQ 127309 TaxID=2932773 RepID=UPI00353026F1